MVSQLPSTISQDLQSASGGAVTNGEDNQNSTTSTTNGGGGANGPSESLGKSPSVVAMVTANSPSTLVTTPLMNFYDAAVNSGGVNTYMTHSAQPNNPSSRAGAKLSAGNGATPAHSSRHFWKCSWQYWVILICVLAFLLAVSFAVFFSGGFRLHFAHLLWW